jgi:hypothetical protein
MREEGKPDANYADLSRKADSGEIEAWPGIQGSRAASKERLLQQPKKPDWPFLAGSFNPGARISEATSMAQICQTSNAAFFSWRGEG